MAKYMIAQNVCNMLRNNSIPTTTIMNNSVMPNTLHRFPEKNFSNTSNSIMLHNLRLAVTPSKNGQESNIYETVKTSTCSSALAGDPKCLLHCQDIRAEVLEKWNKNPKADTQKTWLQYVLYNCFAS